MAIPHELLYGRWLHAHEEDTEDEMVFRPATTDLPPSRGRRGLELNPDGTYAEIRPGPDDRPEKASGGWAVEDDEWLVVETEARASRRMHIVAADGDRIVVRKPGRD
jgi:hypothetical protein